ncbi:MAG: M28 family peptidase [Candidatus Krumholzibacteriia bacterium]
MKRPGAIVTLLVFLIAQTALAGDKEATGGEQKFMKNARALTYQGKRAGEGYFSPDGKRLIFQDEREAGNPFYQIYVLNLETGDTHRVSPGSGKTTCAFFKPGGKRVMFASTHRDPEAKSKQRAELDFRASGKKRRYSFDYDPAFDLFSARLDGRRLEQLTRTAGYDAEGSYSPDGGRIVFCSMRDAYPLEALSPDERKRMDVDASYFGEIYVMDADGGDPRRLTDWPGYDGGPFFSPDGERIVWRHFDESGALADIYTMRADGSDRVRVTDFESMCWAPFYHPSGRYIIFTTNKLGFSNFELYMVDARGAREPVRVTWTDGFDGLPVFSPDGKRVSWTSNRTATGESQLYVADWDHETAMDALGLERSPAPAQATRAGGPSPALAAVDMRSDVEYLASDELEGRLTGSKGTRLAAAYIVERFKELDLEPLGDDGGYLQEFPFTSGVKVIPGGNRLAVSTGGTKTSFELDRDFRPLAFSSNETVEGEVVFAGYGLSVPGEGKGGYDSYAGLDVKDKIVLVLRYVPEDVDMERRQELNHYSGLRYKAMLARERGARALLVVSGPNSPNAGELIPIRFDQSLADSRIVTASVSGRTAGTILAAAGKTLQEVQSGLDVENPHFEGTFAVPNTRVSVTASLEKKKKSGNNVVGLLPAPRRGRRDRAYIAIGAHYDHIGRGKIGSLAGKGEEGMVHNGADDNASGTATVLELAAALVEARRARPKEFKRGMIFALWSGEELGVIGSSFFVDHPPVALRDIAAYINFDMVGRLRDNKLTLQGVGSSKSWRPAVERRNVAAGFDLVLQEDPYLPTDVTAFYPEQIPILSFFTGSHEDYNRPSDDAATLNYDGMERVARFAYDLCMDLVSGTRRPDYAKVERSREQTGGRGSLRAYLGTIPDYASDDVEGVKLSGVRDGGPADVAGLRGGDIIVEFGGQKIANIYDYTYALDAVKIGQPVVVVVLRGSARVTLTVIPEARK